MGRCRVLAPETDRLPLSDGDFLDVKRDLNAGEYFDLISDMADRKPFAKILHYVIGWSLTGLDGKALPYSLDLPENVRRDTVRSLDKYTLRELIAVLDRHEQAQEDARAARKNVPGGGIGSSAISPLPGVATGESNGSEN